MLVQLYDLDSDEARLVQVMIHIPEGMDIIPKWKVNIKVYSFNVTKVRIWTYFSNNSVYIQVIASIATILNSWTNLNRLFDKDMLLSQGCVERFEWYVGSGDRTICTRNQK